MENSMQPPEYVAGPLRAEQWPEVYIVMVQTQISFLNTSLHYTAIHSFHFIIFHQEKAYTRPFNLANSFQCFSRLSPLDHLFLVFTIKCNLAKYWIKVEYFCSYFNIFRVLPFSHDLKFHEVFFKLSILPCLFLQIVWRNHLFLHCPLYSPVNHFHLLY